ncbi:MAG: hypothetical protein M1819_006089 [Sarea resinae]|nr:MAG: hypothetical protein M1819_006089 [Sarea resinae]
MSHQQEEAPESDEDLDLSKGPPRIHYDEDVEAGPSRRTTRRASGDTESIHSLSRRRSVDPAIALPIQYRTISFNVEETKTRGLKGASKSDKTTVEISDLDWHRISVEELYQRLATSPTQGLSAEQVSRRLKEYGSNKLSSPPSRWIPKTMGYLFGGFGSILIIASVLVFVAWKPLGKPPAVANLALGIVLAIVWAIQAFFSFYQDWSSSRVMNSISNMLPDSCLAVRDGNQRQLFGAELVPGDLINIRMGDKLPVDIRFVQVSADAKLDRSILTGEALPIRGTVDSTDNNYLETACIGLAGTHCVSGSCVGVVVATGDRSVFGRIAKLTSAPKTGLTTLEREIYYFVALIVSLMLVMVIIVIAVWAGWLRKRHRDWITVPMLIVDCVSVAVAFIPEGLPIAVTVSLTIIAKTMKENKILCKSLKTVETLGAVSVICSDKTGTLTKNQMTVTDCLVGRESMISSAAAEIMNLSSQKPDSVSSACGLSQLALLGGLCNAGEFDAATNHLEVEQRKIHGDATDQAVLRFAESIQSVMKMRSEWKTIYRMAFNSKNKFMFQVVQQVAVADMKDPSTDIKSTSSDCMTLMIKGAPDILIARCSHLMAAEGHSEVLTDAHRKFIDDKKDSWSREAKRVILLARKKLPQDVCTLSPETREFEDQIMRETTLGLELVGLVGIVDPPRDEIPDVVRTLRNAGIKVFMVTGDFKLTAQAIAAQCGIITQPFEQIEDPSVLRSAPSSHLSAGIEGLSHNSIRCPDARSTRSIVLSGSDMMTMDDDHWDNLHGFDEVVFARTTPEQKLRIVRELQARGETVGMTGDGVNDAPSLKAADIGIAMGSGSDIAIEASDMVLLDSFAGIVEAVKYGRVVFENLRKTICYLLPAGSFSEFWPVFTNVCFGLPQILSSFLMIIICCFTDCAAATAIAYEQPEADVLLRKPRNPKKDHLVDWKLILHAYGYYGLLECTASFAMSYWFAQKKGIPFSTLWFGFGQVPQGMSAERYKAILDQASSIFFVNLVVM